MTKVDCACPHVYDDFQRLSASLDDCVKCGLPIFTLLQDCDKLVSLLVAFPRMIMVHESAVRVRSGVQHHAAMKGKPLAAPVVAAFARRGLTPPLADAATARVPPPLRGGRRTVTAWRWATHRAGAAVAVDAASSTGCKLQGTTCGGRDCGGEDTSGNLAAVGAGTGVVVAAGADVAAVGAPAWP